MVMGHGSGNIMNGQLWWYVRIRSESRLGSSLDPGRSRGAEASEVAIVRLAALLLAVQATESGDISAFSGPSREGVCTR